jgi:hypothetical protein
MRQKSFRVTCACCVVDELHFSWQAQFGDLHRHVAWQAQHLGRVVLRAFFANRIVAAASSGDNVQIAWQA